MADDVSDHEVYLIIKGKLALSSEKAVQRVSTAFDAISADREGKHKGDVNYAAAEHYLFARWIVGLTGPPGFALMTVLSVSYDQLKMLVPARAIYKFGKGPVTPGSFADMQWSLRGATDGLADISAGYFVTVGPPEY